MYAPAEYWFLFVSNRRRVYFWHSRSEGSAIIVIRSKHIQKWPYDSTAAVAQWSGPALKLIWRGLPRQLARRWRPIRNSRKPGPGLGANYKGCGWLNKWNSETTKNSIEIALTMQFWDCINNAICLIKVMPKPSGSSFSICLKLKYIHRRSLYWWVSPSTSNAKRTQCQISWFI